MSKKTLKCGCQIDPEEIKKLPVVECPNCHQKIHKTNYCPCCGQDMRKIDE